MRRSLALLLGLAVGCASSPPRPAEPTAAPAPPQAAAMATPAPPPPPPPPPSAGENPWWKGAVFYEVFVRSYQDSGKDGKGDLKGLISRLDYLNDGNPATKTDLGVDALWLMPVFQSPSYHGYDVVDYETIEKDYGTNEDFQQLLTEAHKRGIKVIVDLVLNHTADVHPWFRESASSPTSAKRDWYVWRQDDPGWGQPWNPTGQVWHQRNGAYYYGLFQGGMPDLNYRNPEVREEAKRIARFWLDRGVDGFRLDAIRYLIEDEKTGEQADLPETHAYLKEFSAAVRTVRPDAALVGEVWASTDDIAPYYGSDGREQLQLLFNFPLASAMVNATASGRADDLSSTMQLVQATYPKGAVDAPFLTNHDQRRIATLVLADKAKLKLAASMLLTMPGSPFIYYGEELGMQNGEGDQDEEKRTPMPWTPTPPGHGFTTGTPWNDFAPGAKQANVETESKDQASVLSRYRTLIAVRRSSEALTRGELQLLSAPEGRGAMLAFLRRAGDETVLVVHNLGSRPADTGVLDVAAATAEPLLVDGSGKLARSGTGWRATLPARGTGIWRVK